MADEPSNHIKGPLAHWCSRCHVLPGEDCVDLEREGIKFPFGVFHVARIERWEKRMRDGDRRSKILRVDDDCAGQ